MGLFLCNGGSNEDGGMYFLFAPQLKHSHQKKCFCLANEDDSFNLGLKGAWTISIRLLKLLSR